MLQARLGASTQEAITAEQTASNLKQEQAHGVPPCYALALALTLALTLTLTLTRLATPLGMPHILSPSHCHAPWHAAPAHYATALTLP